MITTEETTPPKWGHVTPEAGVPTPATINPTHTPETTNDTRRAATRTPPKIPPGRDARWDERSVPYLTVQQERPTLRLRAG